MAHTVTDKVTRGTHSLPFPSLVPATPSICNKQRSSVFHPCTVLKPEYHIKGAAIVEPLAGSVQ